TPRNEWKVVEALGVRCGEDRVDTGLRERGIHVDRDDPPVRVKAAHERTVEHVRELQIARVLRVAFHEALVLGARQRTADPRLRGRSDAHRAISGSNGRPCNDSAPRSVTTVSAPSWSPIRSSGVIGFGWITIVMSRSIVRPGGGSASLCQYATHERSTSGGP